LRPRHPGLLSRPGWSRAAAAYAAIETRPRISKLYGDLRRSRTTGPSARDYLRKVLIRDHFDRDATSSRLMRYRDRIGQDWADIIDFLTMWPDAGRTVVRLLGEIVARPDH
jgi:hypothetical protein